MSFRQNLPRWIYASASKFFVDQLTPNLNVFIEGQERQTESLNNFVEFRMDGPYIFECTKNEFEVRAEINLLIVCYIDTSDLHKIHRMCGLVYDTFKAIPIFKYGDGPDDDLSQIDCMIIERDYNDPVKISHFGRLQPDKQVVTATVEGHYHFYVRG